ncbi:hypothetical protein POX_e06515 [Penicillium oxalicum]|uniref:hypothetical protein n=1 Tax=Penicillium oxalicum TaxID=69781 RepID=UPI0020B83282|nr:hypothetical protein POX_e06515 [Penicillium oxalicum]KAI2788499.1 hypothetical protein POX_e06515 [Penicillium oxalicum]
MSSSILHQCPFCGHVSDISLSLAAFIENPHCAQCGLSVQESNTKMQDELSALFDRQMTMDQHHALAPSQSPPLQVTPPEPVVSRPPITYSITQHYNHSAHVAPPAQPLPTPAQVQAQNLHSLLLAHGIDPSTLSSAQVDLIQNADAEQQQRLIQTWQVYAAHGQTECQSPDTAMDDSMDEDRASSAEPYMVMGYGSSKSVGSLPAEPSTGEPYATSTDPVYKNQSRQWWEVAPASIDSQYGLFEERNRHTMMPNCAGVHTPQWLCPN